MRLLLLICLIPYALGLSGVGLFEPEETRYAVIGQEMAEKGDWLVPRIEAVPYLEKPPLTAWGTALMFKLFGVSEFSARILPALSALLAVFFVIRIGRRIGGERLGWGAGIVLATSPLLFGMGRVLSTDTLFLVTVIAGMDALLAIREKRSWLRYLALGLAYAGAILTKGPLGVLLIVLGALAIAWVDRSWKPLLWSAHPACLFPALALGAPWFFLVQEKYPQFWDYFFVHHHLDRFLGRAPENRDLHAEPWFYYLPILLGAALPWLFMFPSAWKARRVAASDHSDPRPLRALGFWAVAMFAFFCVSSGKRIPYVLPVIAPLAVLLASFVFTLRWERLSRGLALGMCVLFLGAGFALPYLEGRLSLRPIAEKAKELRAEPGRSMVVFPGYYHGVSFYVGKGIAVFGSEKELGFGMSLEPSSGVAFWSDGDFSERLARPGSLAIIGSGPQIRRRLAGWEKHTHFEVVVETEQWMLIRN